MKNACEGVFHLFVFWVFRSWFWWERRKRGGYYDTPPRRPLSIVQESHKDRHGGVTGVFVKKQKNQKSRQLYVTL